MNPPFAPSTPGQTIFARLRHAISRVPNPSPSKKRKWIVLIAVGLLLAAIFWIQRAPSHEELRAYRMGYGMGQAMWSDGGKVDLDEIAAEMGIDSGEKDMFEDGFTDGRKRRKPRFETPMPLGQPSESGSGSAYLAPPPLEDDETESPTGDYAMSPLYGEAPPDPEPTQDTK